MPPDCRFVIGFPAISIPADDTETPPKLPLAAVIAPVDARSEIALPTVMPSAVTPVVFVPSVTESLVELNVAPFDAVPAVTLDAVTVPVVVRPESDTVVSPVVKDSDVTESPVIVVFAVSVPTVTESDAATVLKVTSSDVAIFTDPSLSSVRLTFVPSSKFSMLESGMRLSDEL